MKPTKALAPDELVLIQRIYERWLRTDGTWPPFAVIDKDLDAVGIDAVTTSAALIPEYLRRSGSSPQPAQEEVLRLTVRGLASLPERPPILGQFIAAVALMATRERVHTPSATRLSASLTSDELAHHLQTQGVPRPADVAQSMALAVGSLLEEEGRLWTSFHRAPEGRWQVEISREIRRLRGVTNIPEYLEKLPGDAQEQMTGRDTVDSTPDIDPRAVFVVHGRDLQAKQAVIDYLRDLDLRPMEWEQLIAATGSAAPYTGDAVAIAFQRAQAVVVLLTPDDEARLHADLLHRTDGEHEREFTGQPRPNVFFEAGMALATHPTRTVLVEIGEVRSFSDTAGRHCVRLTAAAGPLKALATRLANAGCPVDMSGIDWLNTERFAGLKALSRKPTAPAPAAASLPKGTVLTSAPATAAPPLLGAKLHAHGKEHLLEISNRGGQALHNIEIDIPAENWHLLTDVLPSWPVATLQPRDHVRLPLVLTMGGPVVVEATLRGRDEHGEEHSFKTTLSIYG